MTRKTIEEVCIEIQYIKELLEREFLDNKIQHKEIIQKQNLTNGNIIRHEDRLNAIETSQKLQNKNQQDYIINERQTHQDYMNAKRSWIQWIPHLIIGIVAIINLIALFTN